MVGTLIRMRAAVLAHAAERAGTAWLVVAGLAGLAGAVSTAWLGAVAAPGTLSAVLALWVGGQAAQAALAGGDAVLPPEMLALLPIPPRTLAAATLVIGLREPATVVTAVALGALVVRGAAVGAPVVGIVAWALTVFLTVALAALAGALVAPVHRRGRDLATVVVALGLAVVALAGSALPFLVRALDHPGPLASAVRALPSGWGLAAVGAAADGPAAAAVPLVGLGLLALAAAAVLPAALARRSAGAAAPSRPGRGGGGRRRILPTGPTGAVVAKELRLWVRDPLRLTCLVLAAVVSVGTGVIPALTSTTALLPFVGTGWIVITAACASNLYGFDGASLWATRLAPGWTTPDVRGRLLAWLLVTAPPAVAAGVVGVLAARAAWAWPWVAALTPALLAGGAALAAYGSTLAALPLDDTGGPTPAWAAKVHVGLYATALTAVPAAAPLVVGTVLGAPSLVWAGVPVALVVGAVLVVAASRAASRRLRDHGPEILAPLSPVSS